MYKRPQSELEKAVARQNAVIAEAKRKAEAKRNRWRSVGKWIADNIVSIGALAVSIIALLRTV